MSSDANTSYDRPTVPIEPIVNGTAIDATVEPRLKLSDFLRANGARSVRVGCEHGACGACSVLVDGNLVKSCLTYAVQVDGAEVQTVEGLSTDDEGEGGPANESPLHPIPAAFHEADALQCGFCTSGFIMATAALLAEDPDPDRETITAALRGNLCRCTGYQPIYRAVEHAATELGNSQ